MSIIEDERLDERRNILEIEDDEDNISDDIIQQETNKETYNFQAVNDLFTEIDDENIDQLAEIYYNCI